MLASAVLTAALLAVGPDTGETAGLGAFAHAYVRADGFAPVDADALMQAMNASLETGGETGSVFLPSSDLHAITMGVLALELNEAPAGRTRLRVLSGAVWFEESPAPYTAVEVTRFNLGPAVRASLVEAYGEAHVAPLSEFGDGPHTVWRLVTQPMMGNRAMIIAAGRADLPAGAASTALCLGQSCLTAFPAIDDLAPWSDMARADREDGHTDRLAAHQAPLPVRAADALTRDLPEPETDGAPSGAAPGLHWSIEAIIETGLDQDDGVDAAYRQHGLLDDSVSAIWKRAAIVSGHGALFQAMAYECARGPAWAEPGGFCP